MPTPETYRTFVALPLSVTLHTQLAQAQRELQRTCPAGAVRWVKAEGLHLTLFFLGEVLLSRLPAIEGALAAVARLAQPFTFSVGGIGAFPNLQRPNVIWVGVQEPSGRLAALHQAVNLALADLGFQPEARAFKPHLTLGRVQRQSAGPVLRQVGEAVGRCSLGPLGEEIAQTLVLFRSELKSTGAEYTALRRFPLG